MNEICDYCGLEVATDREAYQTLSDPASRDMNKCYGDCDQSLIFLED